MNVQQRLLKFDFVGDFLSMQEKKKRHDHKYNAMVHR